MNVLIVYFAVVIVALGVIHRITLVATTDTDDIKKKKGGLKKNLHTILLVISVGLIAFISYPLIKDQIQNTSVPEPKINFFWKGWFEEDPEPQLVEKVVYRPGEMGINGMTVHIPGGFTHVSCKGEIRQTWYNPGEYHRWINNCGGISYTNMPTQDVRLMPIQKPQNYGAVLIDDMFTKRSQSSSININLNVPRRNEEYSTIVGEYTLSFYR